MPAACSEDTAIVVRVEAERDSTIPDHRDATAAGGRVACDRRGGESRSTLARTRTERAGIEALFDAHAARSQRKCERGCALANAAVEIGDDDPEPAQVVRLHKAEGASACVSWRALNAHDPDLLGDALMLLLEGGHYALEDGRQHAQRFKAPGPLCERAAGSVTASVSAWSCGHLSHRYRLMQGPWRCADTPRA
jgi:hypothetical protein